MRRNSNVVAALAAAWGLLAFAPPARAGAPRTENPHGEIGIACDVCHTPADWKVGPNPERFEHASVGYPLEGRHRFAGCRDCHRELVFSHVGASCADCHDDVHGARLGAECGRCHTAAGWDAGEGAVAQHARTSFPLLGAHLTDDCDACHRGERADDYRDAPDRCVGCHRDLYDASTDPAHAAAGLSTDCEACHSAAARDWSSPAYLHPAVFPLGGAHRLADCLACHEDGYAGTPRPCYDCHAGEFAAATEPDHMAVAFPRDCRLCHGLSSWQGSTFRHETTGFPLTGAHLETECGACHGERYAGTLTTCIGCHEDVYREAADPDHEAARFGADCRSCHDTERWDASTWDHEPLFPIRSGAHAGRWSQCSDCHTEPISYSLFDCTVCHEHGPKLMDPAHEDVEFYRYESRACFTCHPTGAAR